MLSRLKYYLSLAIRKPYLILSFIYKLHIGVILLIPINARNQISISDLDVSVKKSNSSDEISEFYKRMNRDSINETNISKWLNNGFDCFLIYSNENHRVIGGMWLFKNKFTLSNLSGRTLTDKKTIKIKGDCIYGANVIIDESHRGKGLNQYLLNHVINYYADNSEYKKILVITGANNGAYISTSMKYRARLIGITKVRNIMGIKHRQELFLDKKEKVWSNADEL